MCLAIPGKVIEITQHDGLKMGRIDYAGTVNTACLECTPDVRVGQYVIVHAGFALHVIDEDEAEKTIALWREYAEKTAEQGLDMLGRPLENNESQLSANE